jgi:hypothetical protein
MRGFRNCRVVENYRRPRMTCACIFMRSCEIDFAVLQYSMANRIELDIGECKSEGGAISYEDVEKLENR